MKASEAFRNARNILFERGWNRGGFEGKGGSVCIAGAVRCAVTGSVYVGIPRFDPLTPILDESFERAIDSPFVGTWNDAPGRTFVEVIDALDRAAKIAEQREADSH